MSLSTKAQKNKKKDGQSVCFDEVYVLNVIYS